MNESSQSSAHRQRSEAMTLNSKTTSSVSSTCADKATKKTTLCANDQEGQSITFMLREALLREHQQHESFPGWERTTAREAASPPCRPYVVRKRGQPSQFKLKLLEACFLNESVALWDPQSVDFQEPSTNDSSEETRPVPKRCCW